MSEKFIQIMNTDEGYGKHWVIVTNVLNNVKEVTIYDSLMGTGTTVDYHLNSTPICQIVTRLYNEVGIRKILIPELSHQNDGNSCGLYSIIYITLLLRGINPYQCFPVLNAQKFRNILSDFMLRKNDYEDVQYGSEFVYLQGMKTNIHSIDAERFM